MTTTFDIDEIERLLAAATPGEWVAQGWGDGSTPDGVTNIFNHDAEVLLMECLPVQDAALIVTLHNSAPAMIAELRELRAENARLRGVVETLYHPLQEAADAMEASGKQLADGVAETLAAARAALGEPQ